MSKLLLVLAAAYLLPLLVSGASAQAGGFCYNNPAAKEVIRYDASDDVPEEDEPAEPDTVAGYFSCLDSAGNEVFFEKVIFPSFDALMMYGYIFRPEGAGPFPGVLIIHGGRHGRALVPLGVDRAKEMAKAGYVVMHIDYRSSAGHGAAFRDADTRGGEATLDCLEAAGYLAALDYVDAGRLGVRGFSRGAHLTATLIQRTDMFKAAAMWCGHFQPAPRVQEGESQATPEAVERWRELSPCANAATTSGELLIMHSIEDDTLAPEQSLRFADALTRAGKEFTLIMLHNAGHGAKDPPQMRRAEDAIMDLFGEKLR